MKNGMVQRREFIKTLGCLPPALAFAGCGSDSNNGAEQNTPGMKSLRKKAAHRKRRMIMNNDGNDYSRAPEGFSVNPESFLNMRSTPLVGSHVDAVFYCTGVFNVYTHKSDETELRTMMSSGSHYVHELIKQGTDSLELMTGFCHEHNMECFWSMRMNDNHDSGKNYEYLLSEWKRNHPELLMGKRGDEFSFTRGKWSMVDYSRQEVRDKVFRILEDVASRYDVDGIEYDFFRHPAYFKPQMFGEPVTQEHCDMMTGLLGRIRQMTEYIAAKRGRPMLIACRVPDSVDYCRAMGLDLEKWLADDLVDIVSGPGYFKLEPWENFAELGKRYDVPVYACFVSRRIMGGGEPEEGTAIKYWRGEALNAWNAGVDGIYTFNRFNPNDQLFRELGNPELLKTLDRIDQVSYAGSSGYLDPGYWLKDGRDYIIKG